MAQVALGFLFSLLPFSVDNFGDAYSRRWDSNSGNKCLAKISYNEEATGGEGSEVTLSYTIRVSLC